MLSENAVGAIPAIRRPSEWADAQHAFAAQLARNPSGSETPVAARWWTNPTTWIPQYGPVALVAAVQGVRALWRRRRRGPAGAFVALWQRGDLAVGALDLVMQVNPGDLPCAEGEATAIVIGEFAPNGAMCLVVHNRRIMPMYNPQAPWGELARRALAAPVR